MTKVMVSLMTKMNCEKRIRVLGFYQLIYNIWSIDVSKILA